MTLRARAPSRIDLAGGTLDLWPLYLLIEQAATVNLAISLYTEASVEPSPDGKWHVRERDTGRTMSAASPDALRSKQGAEIAGHLLRFFAPKDPILLITHSDAPAQAGLGASSSLGVVIAGALNGLTGFRYDRHDLISIVKDVEVEILGTITGAQDHYPPVFGGAMCLWWEKYRHRREPLTIDKEAFENRFLLAYSHQPHRSGATNWEIVRRFLDGDESTKTALARSGRTAVAIRNAIVEGDLERVAKLVGEDWQARREMAPAVSSPELESVISAACGAGAYSAKACGAGGGGCMIVAVPGGKRQAVGNAIEEAGGSVLDYHLVDDGLELVVE